MHEESPELKRSLREDALLKRFKRKRRLKNNNNKKEDNRRSKKFDYNGLWREINIILESEIVEHAQPGDYILSTSSDGYFLLHKCIAVGDSSMRSSPGAFRLAYQKQILYLATKTAWDKAKREGKNIFSCSTTKINLKVNHTPKTREPDDG